jgi:hypothetical protein
MNPKIDANKTPQAPRQGFLTGVLLEFNTKG